MSTLFDFFDLPIQRSLTQFAGKCNAFDNVLYAVSEYDTFKGVALFSLLWLAWFFKAPDETEAQREERQASLLITFLASIVAVGLSRALQKILSLHPRPLHMDLSAHGIHFPPTMDPALYNTWNSFPSDHAMFFFALAVGLWWSNKKIGLACFLWTSFVVLLPRLYLGIHHPSDVVAGALLGILFMMGVKRIPALFTGARRLLTWSQSHQGLFYWLAFLATINAAHLFDDLRVLAGGTFDYLRGG